MFFISIVSEVIFLVFLILELLSIILLLEAIFPSFSIIVLLAWIFLIARISLVFCNFCALEKTILFEDNIFPLLAIFVTLAEILSAFILPLFVSLFPVKSRSAVSILLLFSKFPLIVKLSPEAIVPVFFKFFVSIFSLTIIFLLFVKLEVEKFLFVKILPSFVVFSVTDILSNALSSPVLVKSPFILILLFVKTFPVFSSLDTLISLFALNSFLFLTSFEVKEPFVKISPVFSTFPFTTILSVIWISPALFNFPSIFNLLFDVITPEFSRLETLILSFDINFPVVFTSLAVNELLVSISPVLFTFPRTSICEFACIFPLLFKEPSTFKVSPVKIFPVFSKFLRFIFSLAEILELFSTSPFKETLFPDIAVPANLILSAFIDISPSEYVKSFWTYSFPFISTPLAWTLLIFICPSAVISNFLSFETMKESEFTPTPLSVETILITPAYIPPSSLASIARVLEEFLSFDPVFIFKLLATIFPLSSKVLAIIST